MRVARRAASGRHQTGAGVVLGAHPGRLPAGRRHHHVHAGRALPRGRAAAVRATPHQARHAR